jgi:UPF0716 protein FxsA
MRIFALFTLVALAEMATFFWVESRIGLGWALGLAVATALIGSVLVRRAGVAVIADINRKVSAAQLPARELSRGASVLVSGALLISPGFLTDIIGFLLLTPPVQELVHRTVAKRVTSRMTVVTPGGAASWTQGPPPVDRGSGDVIDVESWE